MSISESIQQLLAQRDRAVAEQNPELFLSTQTGEIANSASEGYMKNDSMVSRSLYEIQDDEDPSVWIALVKERYVSGGRPSHQGYLIYRFQKTGDAVRIIDIRW